MCSKKPRNFHINILSLLQNEASNRQINVENFDIQLPLSFIKDFRILEKIGQVNYQSLFS